MPKQLKICILGGAGFIGHAIIADLVELGHRITVLTRRRQRHRDVLVWPTVTLREGDVYDPEFLERQFRGMDAVINLVGILNERGRRGKGFERAHVELVMEIGEAIQATGVPRLLHMSALNASTDAPSHYLQTKARGEEVAHRITGCDVTSFRPSVVFGENDSFTNRFADLLKTIPWMFPLAKPAARMQPIHVDDVAQCFVRSLTSHDTFGLSYNLGGPKVYSLHEIVSFINDVVETRRRIVPLSDWQARLQASVMEWVPGKPFSVDNLRSLEIDSICQSPCPLPFGIEPTSMEAVVPGYLNPTTDPLNRIRNAPPVSYPG
ncbi:MAG: complex I NDUFA9 subunit family protein [Gammaproteobacteria bacterium]|nr:complex I NDUFA9 subunit family protein [Gammaproteobacteria bacterium]